MTLEPLGRAPGPDGTADATDVVVALVQPHLPTLTWLAACLAPGEHERLVQHALTRALRRRSRTGHEDVPERAWWCSVLVAESQRLEGRTRSEFSLELVVPPPGGTDFLARPVSDPAGEPDAGSTRNSPPDAVDLGRVLALLPAVQRQAVECHHLAGLTVSDTAVVLACPVDEVGHALADARARLQGELLPTAVRAADDLDRVHEPDLDPDRDLDLVESRDGAEGESAERDGARWINALLRTAGEQFRAAIPSAVFDHPSSRMSLFGRGARVGLAGAIAVVIVGIVMVGAGIVRPATAPAVPTAAVTAGPGVPDGSRTARPPSSAMPSGPAVEVGPAAEVVGTRRAWPVRGLIRAMPSTAGAAGGVRMAWEVATGELLVGIPERLLCNDKQIRLRLDSSAALHLDLFGGIGPDQGCSGDSLRVIAFAPLPGQNDGESVVRVTGTTGTLVLPGLSGLELDRVGTGAGLPSVSGVRTIGSSPDVDVQWQPRTGRLLVSARGCSAFATADLGNGTEVTVVIRPTDARCSGPTGTLTHVIQIPPHPPGSPFQVVVFNSTVDRSATTDVFTIPATLLRASGGRALAPVTGLVELSTRQRQLIGVDRIGRSADNRLYAEIDTAPGAGELPVPRALLVADQLIVVSRGTDSIGVRNETSQPGTAGVLLVVPSVSDVHRPLVLLIGDEDVVLPAL